MKKFGIYLLLAAMTLQLCACNPSTASDETQADTTESATETTETTRIQHQLSEDLDFGGETFSAVFFASEGAEKEYYANESSSDNLVAAVYRRTRKTEEFLGVKIKYSFTSQDDYKTLYKSGDDLYQQIFHATPLSFVTEGYLYNLDNLPHVDFSAEWWNAEQMDLLKLSKYPYFAVNDFMITSPAAVLFNRDMVEDNNLEDPYQLVLTDKWTIDKFMELGSAVINDINGDGDYYGEDDIIGLYTTDTSQVIPFFAGCGQLVSGKNEEGILELVINSEKTLNLYEKMGVMGNTPGFSYHPNLYGDAKKTAFQDGTALYRMGRPESMATVSEYEFDTGIVPMPKYNEEQENYMCYDWSDVVAVSGTTKNPALVGAVMEFQAWDSKNEVFPTYYDVLLKTRYSSDMETRQMMDIIFDNIVYEVGGVYFGMSPGFCELWYMPLNPIFFSGNNFAASYRAYKNPAKNTINSFYEAMEKVEGPMFEEETSETTAG